MPPDLGMAVGLILLTGLFRYPYARPPFVAMGLVVVLAYLATFDGHHLQHGCFGGVGQLEVPIPYRTEQAIVVILLGIGFARRRPVANHFLRTLITTAAAAVMVSTAFMLLATGPGELAFCGMAYGASAVLALGLFASRRLATAPLPEAVVRQPDTGLCAGLRFARRAHSSGEISRASP